MRTKPTVVLETHGARSEHVANVCLPENQNPEELVAIVVEKAIKRMGGDSEIVEVWFSKNDEPGQTFLSLKDLSLIDRN